MPCTNLYSADRQLIWNVTSLCPNFRVHSCSLDCILAQDLAAIPQGPYLPAIKFRSLFRHCKIDNVIRRVRNPTVSMTATNNTGACVTVLPTTLVVDILPGSVVAGPAITLWLQTRLRLMET